MSSEHQPLPSDPSEVTDDQWAVADFFLEQCGLTEVADHEFVMNGQAGSVRFGLARCAPMLGQFTQQQIHEMVMTGIANGTTPS